MLLPNQAQPVRVSHSESAIWADTKSTVPQVSCYCKPTSTGATTGLWHCIIGRDLWNTQQPCTV